MGAPGADTTTLGRSRHILDGLASAPVFIAALLITVTVFILETIAGWQAITAAGIEGNLLWRLYQAATYDNLETAVGAAILSLVGGNFVRFIWEVLVLIYDRAKKFSQLRAEAKAEGIAEGEATGLAKGRVEGKAEGIVEGEATGRAKQDRQWQGWFARREAARQAGLPFDEPPPAPLD